MAAVILAAAVDIKKQFGSRVTFLRKARGISQEELAHRCGLHVTYVSGIERGKRNVSLENIRRIAEGLGVSLGELFGKLE